MSPVHLLDAHKYHPDKEEKVIAVLKNYDHRKRYDFLEITTGVSHGLDVTYWKDAYNVLDVNGRHLVCCPGLLYPRSLSIDEVWSRIAERLGAYVFSTPPNWRPDPDEEYIYPPKSRKYELEEWRAEWDSDVDVKVEAGEREYCVMCADRRTYWAVSPPVFLSRHSRMWHLHIDCLRNFLPRRQFGLKPVDDVQCV